MVLVVESIQVAIDIWLLNYRNVDMSLSGMTYTLYKLQNVIFICSFIESNVFIISLFFMKIIIMYSGSKVNKINLRVFFPWMYDGLWIVLIERKYIAYYGNYSSISGVVKRWCSVVYWLCICNLLVPRLLEFRCW